MVGLKGSRGSGTEMLLHNEAPPGSLEARDLACLLHPTTNLRQHHQQGPTVMTEARGIYVKDNQGNQYIEGMAGLWCTALGYGEEELIKVAEKQMRELCYSQLFAGRSNEPSILLAEKIQSMVPIEKGRVFFGLSGSDANDTQIKLMWYYNNLVGRPEKKKIISRQRGYHGVTMGSGSLTGLQPFHTNFDLPLTGILHTDAAYHYRGAKPGESELQYSSRLAANLERLILSEGPETVAAFIAEPVMGAGGVYTPPEGYFEQVQAVLDKYEVFFIDDEVICGFGRTGKPFGADTYNIKPTTMSMAKALSSAYLPISAVVVPEFMYEVLIEGSDQAGTFGHGYTYSGHPVCAAVALRNLELMEEREIIAHVERVSGVFLERLHALKEHDLVGDTRGVGLIGAVELVQDKTSKQAFSVDQGIGAYCTNCCESRGLIVRNLGDSIAFCPPLIINEDQIHEVFDKFSAALSDVAKFVASI